LLRIAAELEVSCSALLSWSGDLALVRSYTSLQAILDEVERAPMLEAASEWDLILAAVEPGKDHSLDQLRLLKTMLPAACLVVLSFHDGADEVLPAIRSGADGFVLKSAPADQLLNELRAACSGGAPLSGKVARSVLQAVREQLTAPDEPATSPACLGLTARELEVLRCLARGRSYKATARELGIGVDTVRTHVRSLYPKLGVHTAAEAVNRAIREKLV
jgi:DNA-binding NarL/FixJ family response regulator